MKDIKKTTLLKIIKNTSDDFLAIETSCCKSISKVKAYEIINNNDSGQPLFATLRKIKGSLRITLNYNEKPNFKSELNPREIYLQLAEKWVDYHPNNKMLPNYNNKIRYKKLKQLELFNVEYKGIV
jgi:hypothetical protein